MWVVSILGTDHFLSGRRKGVGAVGIWGRACQKNAFKGGRQAKNIGCKRGGGGHQRNSFKFCSDGICDNANNLPESQKLAVLMFSLKFMFSAGSIRMPPVPPTLLCTKKAILPHQNAKKIKHTTWKIIAKKNNIHFHNKKMEFSCCWSKELKLSPHNYCSSFILLLQVLPIV